jgi:hypothetical protein
LFEGDETFDTYRRFAFGLLFAVLALLTKIYLAFPPFVYALYVFLFVSPRRGLMYGVLATLTAVAVLWAMTWFFPAYVSVSVIDNINSSAYYDVDHMKRQTVDWLVFSLPLTVAVTILFVRSLVTGTVGGLFRRAPSPFAFASLVNATVFLVFFGGHAGAHMTYLFHLVTPLLTIAVLPSVGALPWARAMVMVALPVAFAINAHYFPLSFERFRNAESTFAALTAIINAHRDVLGSTEVAGPLALAGRPVVDSGHSQYFVNAASTHRWPGFVPADVIHARWDDFVGEIAAGINQRRFDLIIRSRRSGLLPQALIKRHYTRVGTYEVDFPWGAQRWPLDLWEPRRDGP